MKIEEMDNYNTVGEQECDDCIEKNQTNKSKKASKNPAKLKFEL